MLLSQYSPSRRQEVFSLSQPGIAQISILNWAQLCVHVCMYIQVLKVLQTFGREVYSSIPHILKNGLNLT